ncbi:MAG: hypothetical protein HY800_10320 [Ignavibacteriales bacterium]|nr:hypothetical protein [Ignavibacteriales bacterium]
MPSYKTSRTNSMFFHIVAIFIVLTLITSSVAASYPREKQGFMRFFQKLYIILFDTQSAKRSSERPIKKALESSKKTGDYQIMSTDTTYGSDPTEPPPPPPPPIK